MSLTWEDNCIERNKYHNALKQEKNSLNASWRFYFAQCCQPLSLTYAPMHYWYWREWGMYLWSLWWSVNRIILSAIICEHSDRSLIRISTDQIILYFDYVVWLIRFSILQIILRRSWIIFTGQVLFLGTIDLFPQITDSVRWEKDPFIDPKKIVCN